MVNELYRLTRPKVAVCVSVSEVAFETDPDT